MQAEKTDLEKAQDRILWLERGLERRETAHRQLADISTNYNDILWSRSAWSGQSLFTAMCHLEREIGLVKTALQKAKGHLAWLSR